MKKVVCSLALLVVLFAAVPAYAQSYIGTYCWKLDTYSDNYVWKVTYVTDNTYQLTGWTPSFPAGVITGAVRVVPGTATLYGTMLVTTQDDGWRAIHAFTLNLGTNTGTTKFYWTAFAATNGAPITAPFHLISCTAGWNPVPGEVSTKDIK